MVRAVVDNTPSIAPIGPSSIDALSVGARHAVAGLPIRGWVNASPSPLPTIPHPHGSSALSDGSEISSARSVGYGSDSVGSESSIVDGACMCYNCGHPSAALDDEWLYLFHPEDGHTLTLCERTNGTVKEHKLERRYFGNTRYLRQFLKPNLYTRPLKFDVGQLCRDHQRGRCTRGTMCRFLHICQKLGITGPVPSRGTTPTHDAFPLRRGIDGDSDAGGFVPLGVTPPDESVWSRPASEFVWPSSGTNTPVPRFGHASASSSPTPSLQQSILNPQPQFSPQDLTPALQQVLALFSSLSGIPQNTAATVPLNVPTAQQAPNAALPLHSLPALVAAAQQQQQQHQPAASTLGTPYVPLSMINQGASNLGNATALTNLSQLFPASLFAATPSSTVQPSPIQQQQAQAVQQIAPQVLPQAHVPQPQTLSGLFGGAQPFSGTTASSALPMASGSDVPASGSFDNDGMQEVCKRLQEFALLCPQPEGTISHSFWE